MGITEMIHDVLADHESLIINLFRLTSPSETYFVEVLLTINHVRHPSLQISLNELMVVALDDRETLWLPRVYRAMGPTDAIKPSI